MAKKYILVVDDAFELGRLIQAALNTIDPDIEVTVVPSAEEALLESTRHTIDLMITDIRLPGFSGLELTRRFRARYPNVKIIQMTGLKSPEMRRQAMDAGADLFFSKPLSMAEFIPAVEKLLGLTRSLPPQPAPTETPVSAAAETAPAAVEKAKPAPQPVRASAEAGDASGALRALCQSLGALGAALFNFQGTLMLSEGEIPATTQALAALSGVVQAGEQAAQRLDSPGADFSFTLAGSSYNVAAAPVQAGLTVAVFLPQGRSAVRLMVAADEIRLTAGDLRLLTVEKPMEVKPAPAPVPALTPAPPPARPGSQPLTNVPPDENLLALLGGSNPPVTPVDADAFWDSAISHSDPKLINPDIISFDQARQLGVSLEELEKKKKKP
ncbi:MAG TPA: response regulator [Anaerolineaceae bacterium]|nr:response regulator [Anaerolineaceae bacterium]HPN51273.1 response regulator [Anaerolineaceae bacterium]